MQVSLTLGDIRTMQAKPVHKDIEKFGYGLRYSPSKDNWYAYYETGHYAAWYSWNEKKQVFDLIIYWSNIPNDLIIPNKVLNLS